MSANDRAGILLDAGTNEVEFLKIAVGTGIYGVNVAKVCQIVTYDNLNIAPLPDAPAECIGTIYFRDKPILLYDLHKILKVQPAPEHERLLLLVCEFNNRTLGLVIGAVHEINRCTWSDFIPLGDSIYGEGSDGNVLGSVKISDDIVLILDLESIVGRLDPSMRIEIRHRKIGADVAGNRPHLKILYCEDSQIVSKLLIKTLREAGFEKITHFTTGRAGYEFLTSADGRDVDLVITDIEMPEMDGLTLSRSIRDLNRKPDLPVVIFSSTVNAQTKAKCASVGAVAAFSKPEIDGIVEKIDELFKSRAKA